MRLILTLELMLRLIVSRLRQSVFHSYHVAAIDRTNCCKALIINAAVAFFYLFDTD